MHTWVWCGSLTENDHFENLGINGRVNVKMSLNEVAWDVMAWTGDEPLGFITLIS
jgi:hypothetical protein